MTAASLPKPSRRLRSSSFRSSRSLFSGRHFSAWATLGWTMRSRGPLEFSSAALMVSSPPIPASTTATSAAAAAHHPAAGAASTRKLKVPRPYTPTTEAPCSNGVASAQTWPSGFHGSPVKTWPRSHSAAVQAIASTTRRRQPSASDVQRIAAFLATHAAIAGKKPSTAARPSTIGGPSNAKSAGGTKKASMIQ